MFYQQGNVITNIKKYPQYRGWLLGSFIEHDDWFKTEGFEVKCAVHPKGDIKPCAQSEASAPTLVMSLEGKFEYNFNDKSTSDFTLEKTGDYVIYDAMQARHVNIATTDTAVLVFRWFDINSKAIPDYQTGNFFEVYTKQNIDLIGNQSQLGDYAKSQKLKLTYYSKTKSNRIAPDREFRKQLLILLDGELNYPGAEKLTQKGDYLAANKLDVDLLEYNGCELLTLEF